MPTTRCDVTELLADQCAHCRRLPDPDTTPDSRTRGDNTPAPAVTARYPGRCAACGNDFTPGQTIRSDGAGGWTADCCHDQ